MPIEIVPVDAHKTGTQTRRHIDGVLLADCLYAND